MFHEILRGYLEFQREFLRTMSYLTLTYQNQRQRLDYILGTLGKFRQRTVKWFFQRQPRLQAGVEEVGDKTSDSVLTTRRSNLWHATTFH